MPSFCQKVGCRLLFVKKLDENRLGRTTKGISGFIGTAERHLAKRDSNWFTSLKNATILHIPHGKDRNKNKIIQIRQL